MLSACYLVLTPAISGINNENVPFIGGFAKKCRETLEHPNAGLVFAQSSCDVIGFPASLHVFPVIGKCHIHSLDGATEQSTMTCAIVIVTNRWQMGRDSPIKGKANASTS